MREQEQFLQVLDRDEAERRFRAALDLTPRLRERVPLDAALGRVLAADVLAPVDVPSFDRANVDGFAVVAEDTFGASETSPRAVRLGDEEIHTAVVPGTVVSRGHAVAIATGGMMPRGADAVVMIEHADVRDGEVRITRAVSAGSGVSFAGTDITAGETVLRLGQLLTSRDTGVLAAIGVAAVDVWHMPVVAILSTGDEIIAPGQPMGPARVYDSNAQVLADAVRELGGEPRRMGITPDDPVLLRERLREALAFADVVLLSGGTSKGAGDVSYRVVAELDDPGIVAHGVALKPGKPICLAATGGRAVVVLPGFPTSAIFTFHEFVAPVVRLLAGRSAGERATVQARLAVKVNSEIGRTEYLLVGLVEAPGGEGGPSLAAYPMGQGSGSVTTFSRADGFATIGRHHEIVPAGTVIDVQRLGRDLRLADLVVIGSHCIGLDYLLGELQRQGLRTKFLAVGSTAGLEAAKRGECDVAGVHLLDATTGEYNRPFLTRRWISCPATAAFRASCSGPATSASRARAGGRHRRRRRGCRLPDGEPQPGQRHARADRSSARRGATGRLRGAAPQPQRGGRGGGAAPRRLGCHARNGGARRRPGVPAGAARTVRLRRAASAGRAPGSGRVQGRAAAGRDAGRTGAVGDDALRTTL
jgi:putative molybdopterin biosynthesis protein